MSFTLFKDRQFWPLFWTQFLGALNDNYFKNALVIIVTFKSISLWGMDTQSLVAFIGGIFILPFFLFSPIAGQLSDKFQKARLVQYTKYAELFFMCIAAYGFYSHQFSLLIITLFFMGAQSTFFGPMKYSMIPQLLGEDKLVAGNAYIETGTFLAILIGTIAGGVVVTLENGTEYIMAGLIIISIIGIITSHFVNPVPVGNTNLKLTVNPFPEIFSNIRLFRKNSALFNSMLGISWFWFYGAAILSLLPVYTKNILNGGEQVVTLFLAMFTVGIAAGSILCERLSFKRVELGLVPIGTLGMTLFLLDLSYVSSLWAFDNQTPFLLKEFFEFSGYSYRISFDFFMLSVFGGIFTVPLYTLIQERSENEYRSRVIATNNILNAIFMVGVSVLIIILTKLNVSILEMFTLFAILNLVVSVYIYTIVPEFTLRFYTWILTNLFYRMKVTGHESIPKKGACVLVCNHVSYVDWLIIAGAIKRPVRFVMYYKFLEIPLAGWFFRHGKVIPIAGKTEDSKIFNDAFKKVSEELQRGEIVCIFPEGGITRDGELQEFKRGIEHIIKRDPVPVVPMALNGLWGSFSSYKDKPAFKKVPKKIWRKISLDIGRLIQPDSVQADTLEKMVRNLLK